MVLSSSVGAWQTGPMKRDTLSYQGYRFPPEIISHAVWLYHRFGVSFRDVEDLLAQRGITVSYEAIRRGHGHWRVAPVRKRSFSPIVPTTRPIPARPLDALGSSSTAGRTRSAGQPSSHGITARPVASVADEAGVKRPLTARAAPVSRAHTVGRGPRKSADHADPAPRTS